MEIKRHASLLMLLSMLALRASPALALDPYESLTTSLTEAIQQTGAKSSQLLPLVSATGKISPEGRMLSGKLLKYLVNQKRTAFVLGTLPESVIEPYTALLDERDGQAFRQRLTPTQPVPAEVVVLGTYMVVRDRIKINLQAIQVATGKIVFASETDFRNEWDAVTELWPDAALVRPKTALMPALTRPAMLEAEITPATTLGNPVLSSHTALNDARSIAADFDPLASLLAAPR